MSNKISISVDDLRRQGDTLSSLADQIEREKESFGQNVDHMRTSACGFLEPVTVTVLTQTALTICVDEVRFGAQVAKDCAEAFEKADRENAKYAGNMNDQIIQNGGDGYKEQADSKSDQIITNGTTKPYPGPASINYKGNDYSNYKVVSGFDAKYVYKQGDYTMYNKQNADGSTYYNKYGRPKNEGCTETAEAMAYSMKYPDKAFTPDKLYAGHKANGDGTQSSKTEHESSEILVDGHLKKMNGENAPTMASKRQKIYTTVNSGTPVVVRLGTDNYEANAPGHDVVAIGIREGADVNNLMDNDILCADPANGKVRTLAECKSEDRGYQFEDRGSLRVPDEKYIPK